METPPEFKYYLDPVSGSYEKVFAGSDRETLGSAVSFFDGEGDLKGFDVAVIGVKEGVNSPGNKGCAEAPDFIRKNLYGLSMVENPVSITDLGNVKGSSAKDKLVALKEICESLFAANVIPLVLGGSQDLTIALADALSSQKQKWSFTCIDAKIDYSDSDEDFNSENFIGRLLSENYNMISSVTVMGIQKYLCSASQLKFLENNYYSVIRLGEIKGDEIKSVEPYLRDADMISLDVSSVKGSDMPAQKGAMPNGLFADEICQLAWYAGLSDRLKAFGVFELNPINDNELSAGVSLASQIIWHFIEGVSKRYKDYPVRDIESYSIFIVHLDDYETDIRFFNNQVNGRWWVEVPSDEGMSVISCTEEDYVKATNNEIPEKWIFSLKKSAYKSAIKNNNLSDIDEK
ncbi:MAG: hypothetical protein GXO47_13020 [Chlorobi bacterium]|nr:hypothetical protein [Chlorobiota bacterium]